MKDLNVTRTELKDVQRLDEMRAQFNTLLKTQRDDAFKQLEKSGPILPWYIWTLAGAAGATFAIRGFR